MDRIIERGPWRVEVTHTEGETYYIIIWKYGHIVEKKKIHNVAEPDLTAELLSHLGCAILDEIEDDQATYIGVQEEVIHL